MQRAFCDSFAFQCGFCTAGMIVTASTLEPDDLGDLDRRMKGNLCRCTGYRPIKDALASLPAVVNKYEPKISELNVRESRDRNP